MRRMIETLVLELIDAIYHKWPAIASLDDLTDEEVSVAGWSRFVPEFALVAGYRGTSEQAELRALAAEREAEELRQKAHPREKELTEEKNKNLQLRDQLAEALKKQKVAEDAAEEAQESYERFKEQTKYALQDFAEMQMRDQQSRADMRNMARTIKEQKQKNQQLEDQSANMTNMLQEKDKELAVIEMKLMRTESETKDIAYIRQRLKQLEQNEGNFGLDFARRLAQEVLGTTIEDLIGTKEKKKEKENEKQKQMKAALDIVAEKLRAMPIEIGQLKAQVGCLKAEIQETRKLVPVWNADAVQDLIDAFDENAAVHREIFSMKDKRAFAALGTEPWVPQYLRAEGFVRHVFVSKGELEEFMGNFQQHLLSSEASGGQLTSSQLHNELYMFMRRTLEGEALTEFAYAFIVGLEAFRDDPDFELFDLMLCGAVHPSLTQDQQEMLRELQNLIRACEGQSDDSNRPASARGRTSALAQQSQGTVTRRMLRAVLQAVFPDKTPARHNALRRALHTTLQQLSDAGKSADTDSAQINDIFSSTADGQQSVLIEEVRRQHYYEVIDFTAELARRMRENSDFWEVLDASNMRKILQQCDPHAKPSQIEQWYSISFPEGSESSAPYTDVLTQLRHNTLLKPERLWVKASPKDVVEKMLSTGPPLDSSSNAGGRASGHRMSERRATVRQTVSESPDAASVANMLTFQGQQPRRTRGAKVVDNPVVKMHSDLYSTPEGLQRAVLTGLPGKIEEDEEDENG